MRRTKCRLEAQHLVQIQLDWTWHVGRLRRLLGHFEAYDEAIALTRDALADRRTCLSALDRASLSVTSGLSEDATRLCDEAEATRRELVAVRAQHLGDGNSLTPYARPMPGRALLGQRRFRDAALVLLAATDAWRRHDRAPANRTREATPRLVERSAA